jgi:hypothetical protein
MTLMLNRTEILSELVTFSKPLGFLSHGLSQLEWDYEEMPVVMMSTHLLKVLDRFVRGELNAQEIESWANLVEGREDLEFSEEILGEFVYELANPELEGELTRLRATEIIQELQKIMRYRIAS